MHPIGCQQLLQAVIITISCIGASAAVGALGQRSALHSKATVSIYASPTSGVLDSFWDPEGPGNLERQLNQLKYKVTRFAGRMGGAPIQSATRAFVIPPMTGDSLYSEAEDTQILRRFVQSGGLVIVHDSFRRPEATQDLIAEILGYQGGWQHCEPITDNSRRVLGQVAPTSHAREFIDMRWPPRLEDARLVQVHSWCKHEDPSAVSYPLYTVGGDPMRAVAQAFARVGSPGAVLWLGYSWQSGPQAGWGAMMDAVIAAFHAGAFSAPADASAPMDNYPLRLDAVVESIDSLADDTADIVRRYLSSNIVSASYGYGYGYGGYGYGGYPPAYGVPSYPPPPTPSPQSPSAPPPPTTPPSPLPPTTPPPTPTPLPPTTPPPTPLPPTTPPPTPTPLPPATPPPTPTPLPPTTPPPTPPLPNPPRPRANVSHERFLWYKNMPAQGVQGVSKPVVWYDDVDFSNELNLHYNNSKLWLVDREKQVCDMNPPCVKCNQAWNPYSGSDVAGFPTGTVVLYFREPMLLKRIVIVELAAKGVEEVFLLDWPAIPIPELGLNVTRLYDSVNKTTDVYKRFLRHRDPTAGCATLVSTFFRPPRGDDDAPIPVPKPGRRYNQTNLPEDLAARAVGGVGIRFRAPPKGGNRPVPQIADVRFTGRVLYPQSTTEYEPYLRWRPVQ